VQYLQSPPNDFTRVPVGARLHRLGDRFLMLRSKCNGHNAPLLPLPQAFSRRRPVSSAARLAACVL
jgi:hypothetical protein